MTQPEAHGCSIGVAARHMGVAADEGFGTCPQARADSLVSLPPLEAADAEVEARLQGEPVAETKRGVGEPVDANQALLPLAAELAAATLAACG